MKMSASLQRLAAWITIASIMAMLWSGMAHARDARAMPWNEICSVGGTSANQGDPQQADPGAHVQHCAFCSKQDISHALPSRFDQPLPPAPHGTAAPTVAAAVFTPHTHWPASHPRGPPAFFA